MWIYMFESHNQLFSFKGLGIICIRVSLHLGQIKFVFFKRILAHNSWTTRQKWYQFGSSDAEIIWLSNKLFQYFMYQFQMLYIWGNAQNPNDFLCHTLISLYFEITQMVWQPLNEIISNGTSNISVTLVKVKISRQERVKITVLTFS